MNELRDISRTNNNIIIGAGMLEKDTED